MNTMVLDADVLSPDIRLRSAELGAR